MTKNKKPKVVVLVPRDDNSAPINVAKSILRGVFDYGCNAKMVVIFKPNIAVKILNVSTWKLVNSHSIQSDVLSGILKIFFGFKWIVTLHCDPYLHFEDRYGRAVAEKLANFWVFVIKKSDLVICLSESIRQKMLDKGCTTSLIRNGIKAVSQQSEQILDNEIVDRLNQLRCGRILVVTIAAARGIKNIELMLMSMQLDSSLCFAHFGDGPGLTRLADLARELGIQERCVFFGHQDGASKYLRFADVYLNCSLTEGSPLAIIEAMAYGIPIIAPRIPPFSEFIDPINTFTYVGFEPSAIVNKIWDVVLDWRSASHAIRKLFEEQFKYEKMVERYFKTFTDLLIVK